MRLYNTLTKKIEEFKPLRPPAVTFYACGPTVYDNTHIGHLRTFVNNDLLKRVLIYKGFNVNHVMNITDVGHLTGDDDSGEDKLEKGAKKQKKTVWQVAEEYTQQFQTSIAAVNIIPPSALCKATDHIADMIALIKRLEEKGYTYETEEAVYFDIAKFKDYGQLSKQKIEDKKIKSREEIHIDKNKKHPADFALWFKQVGRFRDHSMHWPSPWGEGFPGWHIECSAMSMKYLGETIDIHAGGIDHIPVHHENEIAQSESATDKPFVTTWFHNQFLLVEGEKMSKSLGNIITIEEIIKKGFDPLSLRYLFLQTHYRTLQNFTWEALAGSEQAYKKLKNLVVQLKSQTQRTTLSEEKMAKIQEFRDNFQMAIQGDLQLPQAISVMWEMLKSNIPSIDKMELLYEYDEILGLGLRNLEEINIPQEVIKLGELRLEARNSGDFAKSDVLRDEILKRGYSIEDNETGFHIKKIDSSK